MNREQLMAWLQIEGWELRRRPGTIGPTMVNPSKELWISHHYIEVSPYEDYVIADRGIHIKDSPVADWSTVEEHSFISALKKLGVSYEP